MSEQPTEEELSPHAAEEDENVEENTGEDFDGDDGLGLNYDEFDEEEDE